MFIKYQIKGYNSFWIRECTSIEKLTRDLTDSRGAFKTCDGKEPEFSHLEVLEETTVTTKEEATVFGVWYVEVVQPSRSSSGRYVLMAKNNNGVFMHKKVFRNVWKEFKTVKKTKTINMADWRSV
jgi:hypothetical protein